MEQQISNMWTAYGNMQNWTTLHLKLPLFLKKKIMQYFFFISLQVIMLKMIFNHTSVENCGPPLASQSPEVQKDCNFFLTAIRLASLNQILDPWVYLLLRQILLRKFCQVANAVSNCSTDAHKDQAIILTTEVKKPEGWHIYIWRPCMLKRK